MYLDKKTSDKDQMKNPAPFGPGFSEDQIKESATMEVWATGFSDPGPDYCEFRLFDADGKRIATRRVDGY